MSQTTRVDAASNNPLPSRREYWNSARKIAEFHSVTDCRDPRPLVSTYWLGAAAARVAASVTIL